MDKETIYKEYDRFKIEEDRIPAYDGNPNAFLGQYKKCSVLVYGTITYSSSSQIQPNPSLKDI